MEWMIFGAASAFTFALVSVLDKLLISDHVPNSKVFIVYVGFAQILLGISVLPVAINSDFPVNGIAIAILSGILSGMYLVLMFTIMASQDVSRVVPVVSTYPIFVAILAFFFLNENVTILTMLGILVTVVGAALVSLGPAKNGAESERSDIKALLLLVVASLFFGLSQFVTKIIADDMTIWGQFLLRGVGGGIVCMSLIILPGVYKGVLKVGKNPRSLALIAGTEGFLVFFAILFFFLAVYSGEVYLVSTAMATRPLFVFILGTLASIPILKLLNEPLYGKAFLIRIIGTIMTVTGVVAVTTL